MIGRKSEDLSKNRLIFGARRNLVKEKNFDVVAEMSTNEQVSKKQNCNDAKRELVVVVSLNPFFLYKDDLPLSTHVFVIHTFIL